MSSQQMVDATDLDDLHRDIIEVLREGRATPRYLAKRTGESRQLVSKRLRDLQMADVTRQIDRGLYELADDPLEDDDQEDED